MTRLRAFRFPEADASDAHPEMAASEPHTSSLLRSASRAHAGYDTAKRLLDVSLSLLLLAVTLPAIGLASAAIVLTARQNPLFLQTRTGLHGREFRMLKLRTMRPEPGNAPSGGASPDNVFAAKTPSDPRVTAVGRLLRRTSIDELPQLLNVLAGHMSLVGPRPPLPVEVTQYPPGWRRSMSVKPGITGLWQVCGRSELAPRQRAALDRCYLRRRSLGFDCLILLRTIAATISMRGAW